MSSKKVSKKHAMHITPVPPNMQAFAPLNGADPRYSQLYHHTTNKAYKLGGVEGFLSHNPFKDFKFSPDAMCVTPAIVSATCTLDTTCLVMPCLAELNDWLLSDQNDDWTMEEIKAALFPADPSCLDIQSIPNLKPKPTK